MKVRKEQFLLPKGKNVNISTPKWIQTNRKHCEISKSISNNSIPAQPTIEGLPSALLAKIKPDVVLSNAEIVVSGSSGGQLFWQQQDGILRQALLSSEKDVKSEDKSGEIVNVEASKIPAAIPPLLAITPIATSQVIKMNDYQVILSSESLPMSRQESGKKSNKLPVSTLPPIKPKVDTSPGFVISEQPVTITSIANVNLLAQNQFSTLVFKDRKSAAPGNLLTSTPSFTQNSAPKKPISKLVPKPARVRKKPIAAKKIMLKPASYLLSQSALDYTNNDRELSQKTKNIADDNNSVSLNTLEKKVTTNNLATDYSVETSTETDSAIASNTLPTSEIVLTTHDSVYCFNSNLDPKPIQQNLSSSDLTMKTDYAKDLRSGQSGEPQIIYDPANVNVIGHEAEDGEIIVTNGSCVSEEPSLTNNSVIGETVLIDSDSEVICADGQSLLDADVIIASTSNSEHDNHTSDIIRNEDYQGDQVETILPSDIEHDEEHQTQEYTDNLLSQLSSSRVLPNMSSSQVSSVLNALVPPDKGDQSGVPSLNNAKGDKEPVKCEPTEFVKIENQQIPNLIKLRTKFPEPKYRTCNMNNQPFYRCLNCTFFSLRLKTIERHCATEHRNCRPELIERQLARKQIKCLNCANVMYSKYALQIHLLCDHNVITTEVHEMIASTLAANKALRDSKRLSISKSSSAKTKVSEAEIEPDETDKEVASPPSVTPVTSTAQTVMPDPAEADEEKHDRVSDIQTPPEANKEVCSQDDGQMSCHNGGGADKEEESSPAQQPSVDEDSKQLDNDESSSKNLQSTVRSRRRTPITYKIKLTYRCTVKRCFVRCSTPAKLTYHMMCHQPGSDLFHCPECGLTVVNWNSLTTHLWQRHGIDIDLYCCKQCSYKCSSYSRLINNHVRTHGEERSFLCDICGKGFKTTKQLHNHKNIHRVRKLNLGGEGNMERNKDNYVCKVCSRSFADARILRHHTENVHNKLRPYLCTYCTHTASSKSSLRMHMRQHTGEKPFSCNECDYVTSDHNSLRRHKMRHSGHRPYQCPHCSYNCIQSTTYKAHLKNKHPGMDEGLMFSCPMCPFRTVKKDNYLAHKAEHELGGDPRGRKRKNSLLSDIMQEHTFTLCKTVTHIHETMALMDSGSNINVPTVENTLQFIIPGN